MIKDMSGNLFYKIIGFADAIKLEIIFIENILYYYIKKALITKIFSAFYVIKTT